MKSAVLFSWLSVSWALWEMKSVVPVWRKREKRWLLVQVECISWKEKNSVNPLVPPKSGFLSLISTVYSTLCLYRVHRWSLLYYAFLFLFISLSCAQFETREGDTGFISNTCINYPTAEIPYLLPQCALWPRLVWVYIFQDQGAAPIHLQRSTRLQSLPRWNNKQSFLYWG